MPTIHLVQNQRMSSASGLISDIDTLSWNLVCCIQTNYLQVVSLVTEDHFSMCEE